MTKKNLYLLTGLFLTLALIIVNTSLSDAFFIPSIYRKIYIPFYYWILATAYFLIVNKICGKNKGIKEFISDCIIVGLPIHIYFLLGDLLCRLSMGLSMSHIYIYYIRFIAFLFSLLIGMAGIYLSEEAVKSLSFLMAPLILSIYLIYRSHYIEFFIIVSGFMAGLLLIRCRFINSIVNIIRQIYERERLLILLIFLLAFIARYAFAVNVISKTGYDYSSGHSFTQASDDGPTYDNDGIRLMNDFSILFKGEIPLWENWDHAYGVFIGIIYSIFGRNFYAVTFFQSVLGALIPLFLFFIGKIEFSKQAGVIAALLTILNEPLIFLSVVYGHEALWLPIIIIFTFFLVKINHCKSWQNIKWRLLIPAGILLGALALVRSLYLYFFLFVSLWFLFLRKTYLLNRIVEAGVIFIIAAVLIVGIFEITDNSFGQNSGKAAMVWRDVRVYEPFTNIGNNRLTDIGIDPFAGIESNVTAIIQQPMKFLATLIEILPLRIIAYFEIYQFGAFDPLYMVNPANMKVRFPSNMEFYAAVVFIVGLIVVIRNRDLLYSPMLLPLIFNVCVYGIAFAQQAPRLREVSIPFIYIIGAVGISYIWSFLKAGNRGRQESVV